MSKSVYPPIFPTDWGGVSVRTNKLCTGAIICVFFFIVSLAFHLMFIVSNRIIYYNPTDTIFHLTRIVGLENVWQSPVNFTTFAHHGTAMNLFYPWLTLYPAYWLYSLSRNLVWAYHVYCWLTTFATMLISYWAFHTLWPKRERAIVFALLYALNPYRISDIIARGALGEVIAMTFLPILLVGICQILRRDPRRWYILTIAMVLTAYTHNLSLLMNAVVILVALLVTWPRMTDRKVRLLALLKAGAASVLLCLPSLLPMAQWSRANALIIPSARRVYSTPLGQLLTATGLTDAFTNNIGLIFLVIMIMLLVFSRRLTRMDRILLGTAVLLFWTTTTLFPWSWLSWTPLIKIQFAFRLNCYISLLLAYLAAKNYPPLPQPHRPWLPWVAILAVAGLMVGTDLTMTTTAYARAANRQVVLTNKRLAYLTHYYNHHDYGNAHYRDHPSIIDKNIFKLHNRRAWPRNTITPNTYTMRIANDSTTPTVFTIPVYHYAAQRVTVNHHASRGVLNKSGTTDVLIPPGKSVVRLTYHYDRLMLASVAAALLTLAGLPVLIRRRII